jgi:hypothetical protein
MLTMKINHTILLTFHGLRIRVLFILAMLCLTTGTVWADDFTVERAVNLSQLDSWADISKFQWQEIDHGIQDNSAEMDALKRVFSDPTPKDTVGDGCRDTCKRQYGDGND